MDRQFQLILRSVLSRVERFVGEPTLGVLKKSKVVIAKDTTSCSGNMLRIHLVARDSNMQRPVECSLDVPEDGIREARDFLGHVEGLLMDLVIQFVHGIRAELLVPEEGTKGELTNDLIGTGGLSSEPYVKRVEGRRVRCIRFRVKGRL